MRVWPAMFCVTILLAGCAGGVQDFDAVEAPNWQAGYSYAYDYAVDGTVSARFESNGEVEREDEEIAESGSSHVFQVLSTTLGGDEPLYVAVTQVLDAAWVEAMGADIDTGRGILAFRQRDLAPVDAELSGGSLRFGSSWVDPYLDFPLTPGKKWQTSAPESDITDVPADLHISSQAVRSERVTLPMGDVDAVLVVSKVSIPNLQEAVREIEQEMAAEGMSGSFDMTFKGTIRTWYAPSVQAVVKEVFSIDMTAKADMSAEGQRFKIDATFDIDLTSILAGADLAPAAGVDEAGVISFVTSSAAIHDPTGRFDAPTAAYAIQALVDRARINAAEDGAVAVEVTGAPADHTIKYTLLDARGDSRAAGEGAAFELDIAEPGAYTLLVRAYDGQRLQAQTATPIVADWITTLELACEVAVGATRSCDEAVIPGGAGLQSLRVALESQGTAGATPSAGGTLILRDAAGNEQRAAAANGAATITTAEGLDPSGPLTVEWQPTVGVLEQATVEVELLYGPGESQTSSGMMGLLERLDLPFMDRLPMPALPF